MRLQYALDSCLSYYVSHESCKLTLKEKYAICFVLNNQKKGNSWFLAIISYQLQFFLAAALVLAAAAPQEPRPIEILLDERVAPEGGAYSFKIETENGIVQSEEGAPGLEGQTNVQGAYR